uniref:TSA: Wollemia nobilis Ref_Wollemi_Transcript_18695_1593 transcribed RNA sequence n=1 Tax=Wollemia nobilis TaxID=56998 RepID=A0A0C9RRR0_9CONI
MAGYERSCVQMAVKLLLLLLLMCATRPGAELVEEEPLSLTYHKGPLLTTSSPLDVHLIWYGNFSAVQRSVVADFVQSLGAVGAQQPSVSAWWTTTRGYTDASNEATVAATRLGEQRLDEAYSRGKALKRSDVAALVEAAVHSGALPGSTAAAAYLVLTSEDVVVERFCTSSCGFHATVARGDKLQPYAWVGNAESQCPGQCAWPFHQPLYGPQTPPLVAPNGDVGIDGMIVNIATVLAGSVTNPFNTGYFQGDATAPLEAVSACPGIYGKGAYPGFPGQLPVDSVTGASYNAHGINGRKFLLPAIWDPASRSCKTLL